MSVDEYNKQDPTELGHAIGDLIDGIRGDGMTQADLANVLKVVTTSATAMNEAKAVPEAAAEHCLAGISERLGDHALLRAQQAAEPE